MQKKRQEKRRENLLQRVFFQELFLDIQFLIQDQMHHVPLIAGCLNKISNDKNKPQNFYNVLILISLHLLIFSKKKYKIVFLVRKCKII
jgi:hypothetical protein